MGALLVVVFIAIIFFVSGLILLFNGDEKGRKYGMFLVVVGLVLGTLCIIFQPRSEYIPSTW